MKSLLTQGKRQINLQVLISLRVLSSMASGYAGLDNELFYMDKTMMVFGDAKKVIEDMVKAVE